MDTPWAHHGHPMCTPCHRQPELTAHRHLTITHGHSTTPDRHPVGDSRTPHEHPMACPRAPYGLYTNTLYQLTTGIPWTPMDAHGHPTDTHGRFMGCPCRTHGHPIDTQRNFHDTPWTPHGYPWMVHGHPAATAHGHPMDTPHGHPTDTTGLPTGTHGHPTDTPRTSYDTNLTLYLYCHP